MKPPITRDCFCMDTFLIIIAGLATVAFLIVSIIAGIIARNRRRNTIARCRYRPKKTLMVGTERRCFQLLNDIFGQRFYIIPGVAVSALLNHKVGNQNRYEAYRFIENQTVDFVFCNKETLRPVCAVKLEDSNNPKPTSDHEFDGTLTITPTDLDKFFRSAHLPFIYIKKTSRLDRQTIIEEFSRVIYEISLD